MTRERLSGAVASGGVVWAAALVLAVVATLGSDNFLTAANLGNVGRQAVVLSLVALAQFVVILTGGVDLSIGANVRLTAILTAMTMQGSDPRFLPGLLVAVGIGALAGLANGLIVTRLNVEPFIATLGSAAVLGGIALYVASTPKGRSAPLLDEIYNQKLPGGIYAVTVIVVLVWVAAWWALSRLSWGRHLYATGGAPEVAALSGINTRRVQLSAYIVAGLLGGLAGVLTLAGSGVGDPNAATGIEFTSLAIVVIGGASLAGGRGRLIGVLGGVVLFALLGNAFNLLRVEVWYQQAIRGLIILIAAALYVEQRTRRRIRTAPTGDRATTPA